MGGNNEFFENFERNKYLKKLPSMQRVNLCIVMFIEVHGTIDLEVQNFGKSLWHTVFMFKIEFISHVKSRHAIMSFSISRQ